MTQLSSIIVSANAALNEIDLPSIQTPTVATSPWLDSEATRIPLFKVVTSVAGVCSSAEMADDEGFGAAERNRLERFRSIILSKLKGKQQIRLRRDLQLVLFSCCRSISYM